MAKNGVEKYLLKQNKKKSYDINLLNVAKEYSNLMKYNYGFILSTKEELCFRFRKENFFHLLGFHKLKDTTVYELIETNKLNKENFYDYVLNGNIKYNYIAPNIIKGYKKEVVNISDTNNKGDLGDIVKNRIQIFSKNAVLELFDERMIIDYDGEREASLIKADKIFFKLNTIKLRNMNLFVGYDEEDNKYYANTFFLEMKRDNFKRKNDGTEQKQLDILVKMRYDIHTNELSYFQINWKSVRKQFREVDSYRSQKTLEKFINDKHIEHLAAENETIELEKCLKDTQNEYNEVNKNIKICELIQWALNTADDKESEEAQLELMEYDIDLDDSELYNRYNQYDINENKNYAYILRQRCFRYENKINKLKKFIPILKELEIEEVKYIYSFWIEEAVQWDDKFVMKLIEKNGCFEKSIFPAKILLLQ